jgi:Flp pilus assembly pilin Flp
MDESGQDLVEYALIVAAVALALIVAVGSLTGAMGNLYQSITGRLTGIEWQEAKR